MFYDGIKCHLKPAPCCLRSMLEPKERSKMDKSAILKQTLIFKSYNDNYSKRISKARKRQLWFTLTSPLLKTFEFSYKKNYVFNNGYTINIDMLDILKIDIKNP
jgi:hypothetical protein